MAKEQADNFYDETAEETAEETVTEAVAAKASKSSKGKGAKTKGIGTEGGLVDKCKSLENALAQIEKNFGKGSVMKFGDNTKAAVSVVPTGCLSLDLALGVGGIPRGRIIEIFGPEASGKTTVALHMVAEVQRAGGIAAYVDAEHALDPAYARRLGVDINELYISQPDDGEQALEIAETLIRSGAVELVIVDSVAALVPRAEIEGEMGDSHMGLHARLMSQALRKLTAVIGKTNSIIIFINQLREKIGVSFGNPETTTGGRALKFYSTIRIEIRKGDPIKASTEIIGSRAKVKIAKNKVSPPFKACEFDIIYGDGISRDGDVLDLGVAAQIVTKSGSWFSYEDVRLGQGRDKARDYLKEHPDLSRKIENLVRKANDLPSLPEADAPDTPEEDDKKERTE